MIGRFDGWLRPADALLLVEFGSGMWSCGFGGVVDDLVPAIREGSEDDVATVMIRKRMVVNARNPYWRTSQNVRWMDSPIFHRFLLPPLKSKAGWLKDSEFDLSRRTVALDFGSWSWMTSASFVIPSHRSHGSEAFPPMPPPNIISENIWPTKVVKQSDSKSSVGKRTAKTPCTNNCL